MCAACLCLWPNNLNEKNIYMLGEILTHTFALGKRVSVWVRFKVVWLVNWMVFFDKERFIRIQPVYRENGHN